jgi:xanthine dehydrogenase small subunit
LIQFILNDKNISTTLPSGTTVLDFVRYHQHLTGTKIGCREGDCGACTILVGSIENDNVQYKSATSCLMPIGNAAGKHIVTIEGINNDSLTPVQKAFANNNASQCGFCTPGFIMSLTGCCINTNNINKEKAIASMDGNICRCTGYQSIKLAASDIANLLQENSSNNKMEFAIAKKIVPTYFKEIPEKLKAIKNEIVEKNDYEYLVSGGTDLYVQKHDTITDAALNFSFNKNKNYIIENDDNIEISAATNITEFLESDIIKKYFSNIATYVKLVSSTPIRNMATFAGNFINASPIGDFTIFFLPLNTELHLINNKTKATRTVHLKDFYKGYKIVDKLPEEELTHFSFEKPTANSFFNFEKVSKRTHLDIATVNTGIYIQMDGDGIKSISISAGGVGPTPMLLLKTNAYLQGKTINEHTISEALQIMQTEIKPISDARGAEAYKRLLLEKLVAIHFGLVQNKNVMV